MRACALLLVSVAALVAVPVGAADEPPTNKEVLASQNNLKQIGIAHHNHNDGNSRLATDILDKNGKPLLSWRVWLLPWMEQDRLFVQFNRDEPWDSDHNKKLIPMMPKCYLPIRAKAKEGETFYQAFTGKDALFETGKKVQLDKIADGTSTTVLVIEAGDPVIWTKPGDVAYDKGKPLPKLGGLFEGSYNVCMCDGSVLWVRNGFDEKTLRGAITPAGGEIIDLRKFKNRD